MAEQFVVISDGVERHASINRRGGGLDIELDGTMHRVRLLPEGPPAVYLLTVTGTRHEVAVERSERELRVLVGGRQYTVGVYREGQRRPAGAGARGMARNEADGTWTLLSPMTGLIRSIEVEEGQQVAPHTLLLVMEAMKMNNEIFAVRHATIRKIHLLPGDRIDQGADLITFGPPEGPDEDEDQAEEAT